MQSLAERYVSTMETGHGAGYGALSEPEATVWLSYIGVEMPAEANAALLDELFEQAIDAFAYDDIRWSRTAAGFVQQHTLKIRAKNGAAFECPACSIIDVTDGRITHSAEYIDTRITDFSTEAGFSQPS